MIECPVRTGFFCFLGYGCPTIPQEQKGEFMKKGLLIALKVIFTIILIVIGLLSLTSFKLSGFKIGSWEVTAEEVRMFVTTAGDYLFWVYVVIIVYIIWRKKIRK